MRKILPILLSVLCFVSCPIGGGASGDDYDLSIDRSKAKEIAVHALAKLYSKMGIWEHSKYNPAPANIPRNINVDFNSKSYSVPLAKGNFEAIMEVPQMMWLFLINALRNHDELSVNIPWKGAFFEMFDDYDSTVIKAKVDVRQGGSQSEYKVLAVVYYQEGYESEELPPQPYMFYYEAVVDVPDLNDVFTNELKKGMVLERRAGGNSSERPDTIGEEALGAYNAHYWYEKCGDLSSLISSGEVSSFLNRFISASEKEDLERYAKFGQVSSSDLSRLGFVDIEGDSPDPGYGNELIYDPYDDPDSRE